MRLEGRRIRMDLPPGWEAEIDDGLELLDDGARRPTVVHAANFPLPPGRGDFAGGAIERMQAGDALIVVFEYGPESAGTALFSYDGVPRSLTVEEFSPAALHHPRPGASAVQRFFTHAGRPFCLYVVIAGPRHPAGMIESVNQVLADLEIEP